MDAFPDAPARPVDRTLLRCAFGAVVAIAVFAFAPRPVHATEPLAKVGSYGATFAGMPRGVRNIGMGATGTADVSGFSTGYFNPAGFAWTDAATVLGSYEDWGPRISLSDLRVSSGLPFHPDSSSAWRFGGSFGYARLAMDSQTQRTIFLPEGTGRTFDVDDWLLSGSGAASWTRSVFSVGAGGTAKFLHNGLAAGDVSLWTFDLGLVLAAPFNAGSVRLRPRAGAAVLNLDTGAQYDGREFNVVTEDRAGLGLDVEAPTVIVGGRPVPAVTFAFDYDWIDREAHSNIDFGAGVEVSFVDMIHARIGAMGDDYSTYGVGAGWDFGSWLFRLDYAHVSPEDWVLDSLDLDRDSFGALLAVRW